MERDVKFRDETYPQENCVISTMQLDKLMNKGAIGAVIYSKTLLSTGGRLQKTPMEVEQVLKNFPDVFQAAEGLPPKRKCDQTIPLVPNSKPINIRPYRLPHNKKDAMEELVEQLLKTQTIRPSVSPYSSPAILVKKKDGTWRLCIHYR